VKERRVIVRPWVEFNSSLPADAIWEGYVPMQFGGKTVAEEIGKILGRLGCEVEEPEHAYDHG